jgi:hypothetical protein
MSEVKVNKISPRTACGTVTLGDSGDTITIPAGVTITNNGTQTGFGRTGTVDWDTTAKTAGFTAVSGNGYFVDTSSGGLTVTLPASPSAGDIVAVKDYANTWDTSNCLLSRNGSNIGGVAADANLTTEGLAVTLVYVDATKGWLVTDSGLQSEAPEPVTYITATGGTISYCGNCKIHTFTGPGTFTVCSVADCAANNQISYMVVAGGGGSQEGGGGAGGFRENKSPVTPYTASPLDGAGAITVTAQGYPIVVGGGGTASGNPDLRGSPGNVSSGFGKTSAGGGGGGKYVNSAANGGLPGGSGGGAAAFAGAPTTYGGNGNDPAVSPPQGTEGGPSNGGYPNFGGGGGGATVLGTTGTPGAGGAPGGAGALTSITGSAVGYAGGGGGGISGSTSPSPGFGGGTGGCTPGNGASGGTANTGGGGGGTWSSPGTGGGSGIVVIRYKFQ